MTSIVGIKCKDGVVIGADSSATFSLNGKFSIMEQQIEKLDVIDGKVIVAGTGEIGLGQRFSAIVKRALESKDFQKSEVEIGKALSRYAIEDFASTHAQQGQFGALVAFPAGGKSCLCEFAVNNFQPELKTDKLWYVSMGSGQPITDPFLALIREIFWNDGMPKVNQAVFAVTWILDHAIRINAGGINGPIRIATIESKNNQLHARLLSDDELGEHKQSVAEIKNHIRDFKINKNDGAEMEIPKSN